MKGYFAVVVFGVVVFVHARPRTANVKQMVIQPVPRYHRDDWNIGKDLSLEKDDDGGMGNGKVVDDESQPETGVTEQKGPDLVKPQTGFNQQPKLSRIKPSGDNSKDQARNENGNQNILQTTKHGGRVPASQKGSDVRAPKFRKNERGVSTFGIVDNRDDGKPVRQKDSAFKPEFTPETKHLSQQANRAALGRADAAATQTDDWKAEDDDDDDELEASDQCEINKTRCSPFYRSPCDKVNPVPLPEHSGRRCQNRKAEPVWKPCGPEDLRTSSNRSACYCNKDAAVCCANLTAIPDLSINNNNTIKFLNFTHNNVTVLDQNLLRNWTQLRWLILNRNNISVIHKDSLKNMKSLRRLEIAFNQMGTELDPYNFTDAVNSAHNIKVLHVNHTNFSSTLTKQAGITWVVRHLNLTKLEQLSVDGGRKSRFYLSDLHQLPKLCKFSIKSHFIRRLYCCSALSFNDSLSEADEVDEDNPMDIAQMETSCIYPAARTYRQCQKFSLPNLKLLNLENNSLVYVPVFCREEDVSVVPSLTHLLLSINALINPRRYQFRCLDNLLFLALTGNPLKYIQSNLFQSLGKLHGADLRFTNVMKVEPNAFSHGSLRYFTIKSSNWFVDQRHDACCISPHLFNNTSLDYVDLSYNVFRYAKDKTISDILSPLRTAKTLLINGVGLFRIPKMILQNFTNLEYLGFEENMVSKIQDDAFDNLKQLKCLELSDNQIANPPQNLLRSFMEGEPWRSNKIQINLESNPFSCTCDILDFLHLFNHYKDRRKIRRPFCEGLSTARFWGSVEKYRCYAPRPRFNCSLEDTGLSVQNCLLTITQEILIYVVCLLGIFFLLVYILLYKYRWQVRFWLYTMHVRLTRAQGGAEGRGPGSRGRARFNTFVSYCSEDSHFVLTQVVPALERARRLPLCIHERDFIPGRYFSQNVVERMEESRNVLLVLSNAFLQNDWCRFELFVAQKYGLIYRQIPITVLVLERLRVDLMDAHVVTMMQATPGIEWPGRQGNDRDLANFWSRLGQTLGSGGGQATRAIRYNHHHHHHRAHSVSEGAVASHSSSATTAAVSAAVGGGGGGGVGDSGDRVRGEGGSGGDR
ncbi:uncharacterized protein LOC143299679 [Babylonia areolata]|uniref:uncharacterized protein LOC143299679 n=1 Tax=Babylonia areolata TaxID=304850 RepID=UPI003FD69657